MFVLVFWLGYLIQKGTTSKGPGGFPTLMQVDPIQDPLTLTVLGCHYLPGFAGPVLQLPRPISPEGPSTNMVWTPGFLGRELLVT